jgi:uncharacterized membrane protein YczE
MDLKQISLMLFVLGLLLLATAYCVQLSEANLLYKTGEGLTSALNTRKRDVNSAYYLSIAAVVFMYLGAFGGLFVHSGGKLK